MRSGCVYGVMPCNGYTYTTPHDCACFLETKLFGFSALAPEAPQTAVSVPTPDDQRLVKGPAFSQISNELKTQNPDIALIIKILLAQGLVEVLRHLP